MDESSMSEACMVCHVSEHEALGLDTPTPAPIVADWMLVEARTCVACHHVRAHPRRVAGDHPARDRLPSLAEVGRAR
jgi:hypothetical protein